MDNDEFYLRNYHLLLILKRNKSELHNYHNELVAIFEKIKDYRDKLAHEVDINVYGKIDHGLTIKAIKKTVNSIKVLYNKEYKEEYENIYDSLNNLLINKLWK